MKNKLMILVAMTMILLTGFAANFAYAEVIWSEGTKTEFEITDTRPGCDYERFVWKDWLNGKLQERSSIENCYDPDGWPSTTCCPESSRCLQTGIPPYPPYACEGGPAPALCLYYENKFDCEGFHEDVAIRSVEKKVGISGFCNSFQSEGTGDETCDWLIYGCRCIWNSSAGDSGLCESRWSKSKKRCYGDEISELGNCTFLTIKKEDNCDTTGYIDYAWTAIWSGSGTGPGDGDWPLECKDGEKKYRCVAKLFFFTTTGLIVAIILIAIIYIWLKRKKKNKKINK